MVFNFVMIQHNSALRGCHVPQHVQTIFMLPDRYVDRPSFIPKMPDEDFVMMLQYLEELKGKGREKTKEEAEKFVKDDEDKDVESKEEEGEEKKEGKLSHKNKT